jgi:nitrate reductase (cytochrome), electron transfer subunit
MRGARASASAAVIGGRGLHVGILVAGTAATIGLISGVEGSGREVQSYLQAPSPVVAPSNSRSYADMRVNNYGSNAALAPLWWQALTQPPVEISARIQPGPADRQAALVRRAARRAFDGAPPTIPHAIDPLSVPACLVCHEHGAVIANRVAPRMSHEPHASCVQCHVVALEPIGSIGLTPAAPSEPVANTFIGLTAPARVERAWPGAPPMIPHTTWMRERCDSCHGARGAFGLRTPHPWRQACTQCHAPSAWLDQRAPMGGVP